MEHSIIKREKILEVLNDKLTNDEQGILKVLLDSLNGITRIC